MNDSDLNWADALASQVAGNGRSTYKGVLRTVGARVPVSTAARAQALAKMGGISMSKAIYQLVEIGLQEVDRRLSPANLERLSDLHNEALQDMSGTESGEL